MMSVGSTFSSPRRFRFASGRKVTGENLLVVPQRERSQTEKAIEYAANIVAVTESCVRSITSPQPCVALRADDLDTQAWLESLDGILGSGRIHEISAFTSPIPLGDEELQNVPEARPDGVALLAEAHAQPHGLGRYRDLIRFLERAFALPAARVGPALVEFLDARYGYSDDEVTRWISVRDPATHADARHDFALEPDVLPILDRMEQAARDVLLNKAGWRSPATARREIWKPIAWTSSADGRGVVHKGSALRVQARLMDAFNVFPHRAGQVLTGTPADWWSPLPECNDGGDAIHCC